MFRREKKEPEVEPVFLRTAFNDLDLSLMKTVLEEAGIPVLVRDRSIGGYMRIIMGRSLYGADLYVEKSQLSKAREVLDGFEWSE